MFEAISVQSELTIHKIWRRDLQWPSKRDDCHKNDKFNDRP